MTPRAKLKFLLPLALPLLAGCINDSASWQVEDKDHALIVFRNQQWFWSGTLQLELVVARLPECQRRHFLAPASSSQASIDVFQTGPTDFILRQGARIYQVESRTCNGLQKLDAEPAGGLGTKVGSFRETDGVFRFVADPKAVEPKAAEPKPVEPKPAEPKAPEANPAEPAAAEPKAPGNKG